MDSGGCPNNLDTVANHLSSTTPYGDNYTFLYCDYHIKSPCSGLACAWDNDGWTCIRWDPTCDLNVDKSGEYVCPSNCTLQWTALWPGSANKNPLTSTTSGTTSPTNNLPFSSIPATSFQNFHLIEKIAIPLGTTVGAITVGLTYCIIHHRREKKRKKEKYKQQQIINKIIVAKNPKEKEEQTRSLIERKLKGKEIRQLTFFDDFPKSSEDSWTNENCALFISKKEKRIGNDACRLLIAVYEPPFKRIEADVKLVEIGKITPIEEEWSKLIENFRDELQKSEHPGVEIHNNIYTTKLPPLNQNYKNVSKRKIRISNDFNPDDYIRKYDIVERKIKELFGFAHHFAIYLGNGEVAHISRSEREKNKGQFGARKGTWEEFIKDKKWVKEVEIHHPFIPFKRPELIKKHIEIAVNAKYGKGEYELLGNNCEHFATKCVYGLEMSRQSRITKTYADYLLQAIQESDQSFKKMENDLIEKGILKSDDHLEIEVGSSKNNNLQSIQIEEEIVEINDNKQENQYTTQIQIPPK